MSYTHSGHEIILTNIGDIYINYIDKPYYLTSNGVSLQSNKSNHSDIITKYIYYLLLHTKKK